MNGNWLWWSIFPWKSVCMKLWEICSLFRPEVLSNFNNIQEILHLLDLSCCDTFSIRSPILFQQKILIRWVITIQRNFCLDHTEHNWLSHHLIRSPWSFVKGFIFFTHFRDCSVKTERPKIECCLHSETKFLSGLHVTMQATGRDFQHGSNFCVSLDPSSWLWWSIFSWKNVFTTNHCIKLSPVSEIMKYYPISTTLRNPALTLFFVKTFIHFNSFFIS